MRKLMLLVILGLISGNLVSQPGSFGNPGANMPVMGTITGKVKEAADGQAVEYATISLYRSKDSTMVDGVISDPFGYFEFKSVRPGDYYLIASFIGFRKVIITNVMLTPAKPRFDIGEVLLRNEAATLGEVEIVGEVPLVEYQLDKKVVNVDHQIAAQGGTAVDVLERVPSIKTDLEGNVTLRGSSSFTVLIDGKPGILTGSDALNQIPAAAISKIEIITNPSAKYDPDGTAGIINILTKKNSLKGISGNINLSGGTGPVYSGDLLLNYRSKKTNYSFGVNYSNREMKGYRKSYRESYGGDTVSFLEGSSNSLMNMESYSLKGGVERELSHDNTLSLEGSYRVFSRLRENKSFNESWSTIETQRLPYYTYDLEDAGHPGLQVTLRDIHKFKPDNSELSLQITFNGGDDKTDMETRQDLMSSDWELVDQNILNYRRSESEQEREWRGDLDFSYTLPKKNYIQAGFQTRIDREKIDYRYFGYDSLQGDFVFDPSLSSKFNFTHDIMALYGTWSKEFNAFSLKLGLRGEYTYRNMDDLETEQDHLFEKFDVYPSAYFTYKLPLNQQVQLSYSKRVNRPRPFMLNPYPNFSDSFSSFTGNPDLKPEYAHAFELNYQKYFGASFISLETYYKITTGRMTMVQRLNPEGIMILSTENLDHDRSLGLELSSDIRIKRWLTINPVATVYDYKLFSTEGGESVSKQSTNWNASLELTAELKSATQIMLNGQYEGPSVTVDGTREGSFYIGLAARQGFLDNQLSLTLNLRDVLDSRRMKNTSEGMNFFSENQMWRQAPMISLSLSYRWNNFSRRRTGMESGNGDYDVMDMSAY